LVDTGIPQGSVTGPPLYIVYVNDLPKAIKKSIIVNNVVVKPIGYIDDLAVMLACKTSIFLDQALFSTNGMLEDWCAANFLCLNQDKTKKLEFKLSSDNDENVKFLGIIMQQNLKWDCHIEHVGKKIVKGIFLIRKLRFEVSLEVLCAVYYAHIQSHLMYGIIIWGRDSNVKKLLLLQKRAIRAMMNVDSRTHCKPLFKRLGVLTVPSIFVMQCLLFIKSNLKTIPQNNSVHNHFTRFNNHLKLNQCKFSSTINSFLEFGKRLYNTLPQQVKNLELVAFKNHIKSMLLELSIYSVDEFIESVKSSV